MNRAEFAADRTTRLQGLDDTFGPVVARALRDFKSGTAWYAPIVDKAIEVGGEEFSAREAKVLRETLAKTKDPESTGGDTADRLTKWVSTYVLNATEHAGAEDGDSKTWVTMHDDRVRHVHAALDGKTIPAVDTFDVGGARLAFPGQPVGDPSGWINCRCVLKRNRGAEMSLTADVGPKTDPENEIPKPDPADEPAENPEDPNVDDVGEVPFHGVATVVDRPTGDNRQLAGTGFQKRELPLPLFFQRVSAEGHSGSTIVGRMTRIDLNDAGEVEYEGFFNFTPEAGEAIQGVAEQWLRGVSVDLDSTVIDLELSQPAITDDMSEIEAMDAMQRAVTVFKEWRVSGLTMVGIPAFQEGFIRLGTKAEYDAANAHEEPAASADENALVAAAFAPGTHDGPGWITAPVPTGRIRRYWTHGEGAAKIQWGVPGDFNRCRAQLGKYIAKPEWLAGACANMHKEATGAWPGHAATEGGAHSLIEQGAKIAAAFSLVASVGTERELPPVGWFQNPQLSGPTPITIEGDRIFGHIATWGTCHLGMQGVCTTAPRSNTDYAWFRLGAVETTGGLVPVGQITMDTGHTENPRATAAAAVAHYDNTGFAVADVAAGEDAYGIWFAGRLRPNLDPEHRDALLAAKLSGDWRRVQGNLELVAALAVNTPGFGIPRVSLAASGAEQLSLVAAGIVLEAEPAEVELSLDEQIDRRVANILARRDALERLPQRTARLRELAVQRRHDRVQSARARLRKDV